MSSFFSDCKSLLRDIAATRSNPALRSNFFGDPGVMAKTSILINDVYKIKDRFFLTDENIINLAGGFPTDVFLEALFKADSVGNDVIKTELVYLFNYDSAGNKIWGWIKRTVDLANKTVLNDVMYIGKKKSGIGTNLFINQILEMIQLDFNAIQVTAAGPELPAPPVKDFSWDGYKIWIKYGYILKPDSHVEYHAWKNPKHYREDTLNHLYWWQQNYDEWERTGFTWKGTFQLKKSRKSLLLFKIYLWKKHINVPTLQILASEAVPLLLQVRDLYKHK